MVIKEYFIGIVSWVMSLVIILLFDGIFLIKHDKGVGFRWKQGELVPNRKMDEVVWFRFLELVVLGMLIFPIRWTIVVLFKFNHIIYWIPLLMLFFPAAYLIIIKTLPNHPYDIRVRHWVWSILMWILALGLMFLFGYLGW